MSQSHQVASKKNDSMQTKKIFEDDIGDDFLSSWKPSVLKNDTGLDFGNDTAQKAKKNSFSLDKFDVDFDFDGGFGKFSTFSVDMSDIDFRSPSSKTQKSKSKVQESQEERKEAKGDSFKFEFDFKGLDGFDLDCPLLKEKEENKPPEHEKLSIVSSESNEIAAKSKSKVFSKATNNNSEGTEDRTLARGQTAAHSKFRLPELNIEEVESQEGFAPKCSEISTSTIGSQDIETKSKKQTTAAKQDVIDTSFGNLIQTGGSSIMKEVLNPMESKHPDNASSSKTSSFHTRSGEKGSLQNASSTEDTVALKDSQRDQMQSSAVGFAPKCLELSRRTSGSQETGSLSQKQTTAAKQDVLDTSFGNLLQTGGSNTMKETFNPMESKHPDNVSSTRTSSFHSPSGEKVSLHNASLMKDTVALKDSREEQQQSLAKTGPHHTEMPDSDSSNKNSSPLKNECSKWSSDNCMPGSILKSSDTSSGKKVPSDRLNTVVQKDMDDNNKGHMSQCQNPETSIEYQHTLLKPSFLIMQRENTTRKPVATLKHKLYLKESIGDITTKAEPKAMTEAVASMQLSLERHSLSGENANSNHSPGPITNFEGLCTENSPDSFQKISGHDNDIPTTQQKGREPNGAMSMNSDDPGLAVQTDLNEMENSLDNCTSTSKNASPVGKPDIVENISVLSRSRETSLRGLKKSGHIPSSTTHGNRTVLDRISSASQSKPSHHTQKCIPSEVSKVTEPGERTGKHPLHGSSKLLHTETKVAFTMIPEKYPPNHPSLQVSRPMVKNDKSPTILKQTNKRIFSSSKATKNLSTNISITKNIQAFTEQKKAALSPLPPLKRKPIEKLMADTINMKPLKRISGSPPVTEINSTNTVGKIQIHPTMMESGFPDRTYGKTDIEHSSSATVSENKLRNSKKITESVVKQEISKTDREVQVSSNNEHEDQHANSCSASEMNVRDSQDILMLENDNIAEKADSCSRDLEDMCKMLKKKHEEAKDLLVRAIVNNNLLLMLNHPLHEEKIQSIQKHIARMFPEGCRK